MHRNHPVFLIVIVLAASLLTAQQKKSAKPEQGPKNSAAASQNSAEQNPEGKKPATQTGGAAAEQGTATEEEKKDEGPWKGLQWRLIGPFRGGRALAVAGVVGEQNTFYFGSVAGGVWKTTDGGINWKPMFDKATAEGKASPSIGAIAVSESDPNVIYVGTGEACIRGNIIGGNGVYKSIDAGKTWKFVGLPDTRAIGRLIVHPRNPDIAYVAALGHPYGTNTERGIFRTTDGGKSWQRVLYKDDHTGGIDITFDPSNPNILFAALWEAHRTPWSLESGGPGSGLYRSADAGATWKQIKGNGLPEGVTGRIGVTVSGANPNRVWALVEADKGGIFRSDDGGEHWQKMNEDRRFRQRAWYYTHIFADPKNPDSVYVLNTGMYRSSDGGRTFNVVPAPHGDHHGLWIDPTNPQRMIESNDGGANVSMNGGETWSSQGNQPTAQFYHVITDNRFPYYVYGAQQDNSSIAIASASDQGAIDRPDWYSVGGCESGYIAPNPKDPNITYAGCYGGSISRYDHRTGSTREITAWPVNPIGWAAGDLKYRFGWTEPIVVSPHDPKVLYHAAEVLFKTSDEGMSWTKISPDLTRNDKAKQQASGGPITKDNTSVEYYDTIFTVAESPLKKDLLWVGTDDGLIQLTQDGGQHWQNVTPKELPDWSPVSLIEASPHDAGTAFAAVDRHKLDDNAAYIFKTTDFGKSWTRVNSGIPKGAFVHAVREDKKRRNLLYAGTEQGVYISWDGGGSWQAMQTNLPVVPVHDLALQNNDLVVATHGRAFWVLDDVTPLQEYTPQIANAEFHLYTPRAANHTRFGGGGEEVGRGGAAVGKNPPNGAVIYYSLKTAIKKDQKKAEEAAKPADSDTAKAKDSPAEKQPDIKLEVLDASGKVIRTLPPKDAAERGSGEEAEGGARGNRANALPGDAGLNRFVWDQRYEGASRVPNSPLWGGSTEGPDALPGKYQVRLTVRGQSQTAPLEIVPDTRLTDVSPEDLQKQFNLMMQIRDRVTQAHDVVNQIRDLRKQMEEFNKRLTSAKNPNAKQIEAAGKDLDKKMTTVEEALIQTKAKASQDVLNFPIRLNNQLVALGGVVGSADGAPTQQSYEVFEMLSKQVDEQLAKWKAIVATDVVNYNATVKKVDVPAVMVAPAAVR